MPEGFPQAGFGGGGGEERRGSPGHAVMCRAKSTDKPLFFQEVCTFRVLFFPVLYTKIKTGNLFGFVWKRGSKPAFAESGWRSCGERPAALFSGSLLIREGMVSENEQRILQKKCSFSGIRVPVLQSRCIHSFEKTVYKIVKSCGGPQLFTIFVFSQ